MSTNRLSLRNLYYLLLGDDGTGAVLEKGDSSYAKVGRYKTEMCRSKELDWDAFEDASRDYEAYGGGYDAIDDPDYVRLCQNIFKFDVWSEVDIHPQLWIEARSLMSTLGETAREMRVNLYPSGGYAPDGFARPAAHHAFESGRGTYLIIYVGDHDDDGLKIAKSLQDKLDYHLG